MAAASRGSLRNKVVAVAAVGLVGLGVWLANNGFRGPGLGGSGTGEGTGEGSATSGTGATTGGSTTPPATGDVSVDLGSSTSLTSQESTGTAQPGAGSPEFISVMIFGAGYRLPTDPAAEISTLSEPLSTHFTEATLDDVVAAAKSTTGTSKGIRVDVLRHHTATAGARTELVKRLQDEGLRPAQILVRDEKFYE